MDTYHARSAEYTSESGMVKKLRRDAGQRGANGIVLDPIHAPGAGAKVAGALFGIGTQRKGEVVAVHWWVRSDSAARATDDEPLATDRPGPLTWRR